MSIVALSGGGMGASDEFDALAEACIANHAEIVRIGSPEMQTASRMLLYALAEEIRRRSSSPAKAPNDED